MTDEKPNALEQLRAAVPVLRTMTLPELELLRRAVHVRILDTVDELKRDGATWNEIGEQMAMTGAAAHARYATGRHLIESWRPVAGGA